MTEMTDSTKNMAARDWMQVLKKYREPNSLRSSFELGVSVVPFVALWVLACWIANYSYIAALGISAVNGCFLLRLFCISTIVVTDHFLATAHLATGPVVH